MPTDGENKQPERFLRPWRPGEKLNVNGVVELFWSKAKRRWMVRVEGRAEVVRIKPDEEQRS